MKLEKRLSMGDVIRLRGDEPTKNSLRRLRRWLRRVETRVGEQLLFRDHPSGPVYTTRALLEQHLAHLVDRQVPPDEMAEVRRAIAKLQGEQFAMRRKLISLGRQIREISS